jgi:hypothetical protein
MNQANVLRRTVLLVLLVFPCALGFSGPVASSVPDACKCGGDIVSWGDSCDECIDIVWNAAGDPTKGQCIVLGGGICLAGFSIGCRATGSIEIDGTGCDPSQGSESCSQITLQPFKCTESATGSCTPSGALSCAKGYVKLTCKDCGEDGKTF